VGGRDTNFARAFFEFLERRERRGCWESTEFFRHHEGEGDTLGLRRKRRPRRERGRRRVRFSGAGGRNERGGGKSFSRLEKVGFQPRVLGYQGRGGSPARGSLRREKRERNATTLQKEGKKALTGVGRKKKNRRGISRKKEKQGKGPTFFARKRCPYQGGMGKLRGRGGGGGELLMFGRPLSGTQKKGRGGRNGG